MSVHRDRELEGSEEVEERKKFFRILVAYSVVVTIRRPVILLLVFRVYPLHRVVWKRSLSAMDSTYAPPRSTSTTVKNSGKTTEEYKLLG